MNQNLKIALVGNPNVGKTSLFNQLTGLNQKVGNYPGITVDKKTGTFLLENKTVEVIDLPGTYSLFPSSKDEEVVFNVLTDQDSRNYPDKVMVVADASNLKRSLLLFGQVKDLGIPVLLVMNMMDEAQSKGLIIDFKTLEKTLGTQIIKTNARTGKGISELKKSVFFEVESQINFCPPLPFKKVVGEVQNVFSLKNPYLAWHYITQKEIFYLHGQDKERIEDLKKKHRIISKRLQVKETIDRYKEIDIILENHIRYKEERQESLTENIDAVLTHKVFGFAIFVGILFLVFETLFTWSSIPMDLIDSFFGDFSIWAADTLPEGPISSLIADGIIPGIGGVVIFVPQIAILFFFLAIMEETGYMSRVVFLMDRLMRPFGLSGKSVVPLMSGVACAIPAIMATRNIENDRERLMAILVTPFITCAARLPVYAILIEMIIPDSHVMGFSLKATVLMGLYLLGVFAALASALILKYFIKSEYKSYLLLEMPNYKIPLWKNIALSVYEKSRAFVLGAGKIILAVSIILWVLGTHGPQPTFGQAEKQVLKENPTISEAELANKISGYELRHSYLGKMGQAIEPIVEPLGYDWKMGIGLIASIAAREVFVGTLASIYSMGEVEDSKEDYKKIKNRLEKEINPNTGKPVINFASGVSLLLFYAFAMQCISTLAIVRKETKSWKWPLFQLVFMTGLAYMSALIAYQLLK
ncbi:MAG: ferrous iron transport protein B [Flavobacteriales bacterium]